MRKRSEITLKLADQPGLPTAGKTNVLAKASLGATRVRADQPKRATSDSWGGMRMRRRPEPGD
jgi:hypothetical protein